MGNDGQERTLQGTRRSHGVNEITAGFGCDVTVGRANSTNAAPVDPAIRITHMGHGIFECELLIGT